MLSEEEKKAIERFKANANYCITSKETTQTILNLIEKQSKEIEELNKENLEIRDWKYVIDSSIDLDKLKELDLIKIKGKEYVSKDKIKAKIEEYERLSNNITMQPQIYPYIIDVLQSLLEKE